MEPDFAEMVDMFCFLSISIFDSSQYHRFTGLKFGKNTVTMPINGKNEQTIKTYSIDVLSTK